MGKFFVSLNCATPFPPYCPACGADVRTGAVAFVKTIAVCPLCALYLQEAEVLSLIRHSLRVTVGTPWYESCGMLFFAPGPLHNPRLSMLLQVRAGYFPPSDLTDPEQAWLNELGSIVHRIADCNILDPEAEPVDESDYLHVGNRIFQRKN